MKKINTEFLRKIFSEEHCNEFIFHFCIFAFSLYFLSFACRGGEKNGNLIERLEESCRIDFGESIKSGFGASRVDNFSFNGGQYFNIQIDGRIKYENAYSDLKISLSCPFELKKSEHTAPQIEPRQLIAQQDVGGRYYRHVAWQQDVVGLNWRGKAAYVDYLYGDGVRSPSSLYLICFSVKEHMCLELDASPIRKSKKKNQKFIEDVMRGVKYLE